VDTDEPNDPPPPLNCTALGRVPPEKDRPLGTGTQIVPPVWRYRLRRAGSVVSSSGHDAPAVRLTSAEGDTGALAVTGTRRMRGLSKAGLGVPNRKPM
jgi:hypothetical protein